MDNSQGLPSAADPAFGVPAGANINPSDVTDANFNYDIKEMPMGYNMEAPMSRIPEGDVAPIIPILAEKELDGADPALEFHGLAPAGVPSPYRQYKMASDIFGTGMDKSWNGSPDPPKPPPQQYTPGLAHPTTKCVADTLNVNAARARNEPSSFKITEQASENSGSSVESANSPAARKARESTGNPLTGQGYREEGSKTAKRYYGGSNANQKLW